MKHYYTPTVTLCEITQNVITMSGNTESQQDFFGNEEGGSL